MSAITTLPEAASLFVLGLGLIIVASLLRKKFYKPQGNLGVKERPDSQKINPGGD